VWGAIPKSEGEATEAEQTALDGTATRGLEGRPPGEEDAALPRVAARMEGAGDVAARCEDSQGLCRPPHRQEPQGQNGGRGRWGNVERAAEAACPCPESGRNTMLVAGHHGYGCPLTFIITTLGHQV
jgi:hypothetical protein